VNKPLSIFACIITAIVLLLYRIQYSDIKTPYPLRATTWDALGYYLYLPAVFLHDDIRDLSWFDEIDKKYQLSGGLVYQFNEYKNGNHVLKYLGGVAIIETPFYFVGHLIAKLGGYETDGFSAPYQYSISFGILFYFILSIFLLRLILLKFFSDRTTALTLILLLLATNAIQYAAINSAMSHAPIFPLYVLILYTTIKWHENPHLIWASLSGFIIGLATICRPTEAIMFLIPLLWNTQNKEVARIKWELVKTHKPHLYSAVIFGFVGILPQLIYWKYITGSFIYDVGSAWDFLTPHFRVLVGWEKGWFIYTPVTIFFIVGLFFIRKFPFRKAVVYFCLINIYIIISWRDWRYGGSYSTRALIQSYPVFALAFGALIERINSTRWRYVFYVLSTYLIFLNLFQLKQYNNKVLHYNDMNRRYYGKIYLNNKPTPLDMSLLDTKEWIRNENKYTKTPLIDIDSSVDLKIAAGSVQSIAEMYMESYPYAESGTKSWLKIESTIELKSGFDGSFLNSELNIDDSIKHNKIRLFNPVSQKGYSNDYAFYVYVPKYFSGCQLKLYVSSKNDLKGTIKTIKVTTLVKK
jgi:hypothetical protein